MRLNPAFLEYLGKEDDRIQKASHVGNAQTTVRTNYAADIGFGQANEQVMLTILLPEYHREKEEDMQRAAHANDRLNELEQQYGPNLGFKKNTEEFFAFGKRRMQDQIDNWAKLRSALGEEAYAKLYTYLYFDKWKQTPAYDEMWRAGRAGLGISPNSSPTPNQPDGSPNGSQDLSNWHNPACLGAYGQYFDHIRIDVENNKRATAEGRKPEILLFPFGPPRNDRERAAFDIVLEGARHQQEYYDQWNEAYDRYRQEHHLQQLDRVPNNPFPPEIEAVNQKYSAILDETIARLRQALGEESFKEFDQDLYPKCVAQGPNPGVRP